MSSKNALLFIVSQTATPVSDGRGLFVCAGWCGRVSFDNVNGEARLAFFAMAGVDMSPSIDEWYFRSSSTKRAPTHALLIASLALRFVG
jgi:hypothetical protein